MDLGLLLLRLLVGVLLCGHATQKLFGWFGGGGPSGTGTVFARWGFVPGPRMAVLAGLCEVSGAASLGLGLLTPAGGAVVVGTMTVAVAATAGNGFWAQRGGCEVPLLYGALAAVLVFTGPGRWSLDAASGLGPWYGWTWGLGALALGLVAAAVPLRARARVLRGSAAHEKAHQEGQEQGGEHR
ncbi:DoxX family protein [Streptomyces sp. NPDC058142]|uniref:DoxX family protein n=1 Tax=Streptomyces sp. NPDC058142 TaxID=3346355 RepID=UPI0036EEB1AB